jgi:hypothetical protein
MSDKNVKLAGSHYVAPKWNTGETLKAYVTRQLLKNTNAGQCCRRGAQFVISLW